jgi:hypothetical protein
MRVPRIGGRRTLRTTLVAGGCLMLAVVAATPSLAGSSGRSTNSQLGAGPALAGLELANSGPCKGGLRTIKTQLCTHGPDPAPIGFNTSTSRDPVVSANDVTIQTVQCVGNGTNGDRIQVIYARASDVTDRFTTVLPTLRTTAEAADAIFNASAGETGGSRHLRFVHDSSCNITVARANMPNATDDDSFDNTVAALRTLGFTRTDRKYMVFVDASGPSGFCGQGNILGDDQSGPDNINNAGPSFALSWCWTGATAAHEVMHNLGGVQMSAPHSSGGWHCIDEWDRMCYSDLPNFPTMQFLCTDSTHDNRFDCNHDDYFSTNPTGNNYLRTHWNTTNSFFLTGGPRWAYVWANQPTSSSYTPSTQYQRNSSGAKSTISRTGTGAYTVKFTNLSGGNGIVNVTAYDSSTNMCKVSSWTTNGSNREAGVRCFTNTGAATDSMFTVSYTRAQNNPGEFGYVRADQPTTSSYTPGSDLRFNSTGGTNTVTRSGTGNYTVTMPGLGAAGTGTVLVTAFGTDSKYCKVVFWSSNASSGRTINVHCYTAGGSPSDSQFTVTYANQISNLGVTGAKAGYVWADQPAADSYPPFSSYQYNSSGATNTVSRNGTGNYTVHLPGIGDNNGHVQVTAYGSGNERCKVGSWGAFNNQLDATVLCFTPAGAPVDTFYTLSYTR